METPIFNKWTQFLIEKNWRFTANSETCTFEIKTPNNHQDFLYFIKIQEKFNLVTYTYHYHMSCPPRAEKEMIKYISKLNNILIFGSYILQKDSILFRYSVDVEGLDVSSSSVDELIKQTIFISRSHSPYFSRIIKGQSAEAVFQDFTSR